MIDSPLFPVGERIIVPGVGASPGRPLVDPRTGEVLICRRGGTTVVSGTEVVSVIPDYCVVDVDPQTGRRFALTGVRDVAVLSGDREVLRVTLPYTTMIARYNPKNGLLYVLTETPANPPQPPNRYLSILQGGIVLTTTSLGPYGGCPEFHPDTGLAYVPAGNTVLVFSGAQGIASIPVTGPVQGIRFHPYNGLMYVWGGYMGGHVTAIAGTTVQGTASVTSPVDLAPDLNRDYVYVTNMDGGLVVLSRTTRIAVLPMPGGLNFVDVLPGSGEIFATTQYARALYVFSPSLTSLAVISTPITPWAVRVHPSGRVYVPERDSQTPLTELLILSRTIPLARLPSGYGLGPVAVRPDTGVAYALDTLNGTLYLLSGTQVLTSVSLQPWMASSLAPRPESMALDPGTGMVYVGRWGFNGLWAINETEVQTFSLANFGYWSAVGALAADPAYGVVYAGLHESSQMLLIRGTEILTSIQWPESPLGLSALAVDAQRGWLYGLGRAYAIAVFSITTPVTQTFWVTSVNCGMATFALAVQPANGLAYAGCGEYPSLQGVVQILSGPEVVARVPISGYAKALAADPDRGWVYGALSGARAVAVFSGTTMYIVPLPFDPDRAWYNPVDGMGYIAGGSQVAVLDGTTLRHMLRVGIFPDSMAFDQARERAYLTHYGDNRVMIFGKLPYKAYLPLVLRAR